MKLTSVAFLAVILMRDEMTAVFIVLFHLMAPIHVFHILFVLNFLFVNNMMVIILMQGYIHLTLSQIQAERKAGSTCLCAYHSQYHYRQSGHFNELLFHRFVSFYLFVVAGLGVALCLHGHRGKTFCSNKVLFL